MTRARMIAAGAALIAGFVAEFLGGFLGAFLGTNEPAAAQTWPTRPVTMVVPFGAGGATDVMARVLAPRLSELLGQQVIEGLGINMVAPERRTPEFLAGFLPAEIENWATPIRASGLSME